MSVGEEPEVREGEAERNKLCSGHSPALKEKVPKKSPKDTAKDTGSTQ